MLFKLENKKGSHEAVNSQWSALRGFNWQHPQPTDLFCHTVLFAKFIMLTSFSSHFYWNSIYPHLFFQWSKGNVSPQEIRRDLFLKALHDRWGGGGGFWGWGAVLHRGLMIGSCQGWESFTNAFSSNLKNAYKS